MNNSGTQFKRSVIYYDDQYELILPLELVPSTCFYQNLRNELKIREWNKLKKYFFNLHNNRCVICNNIGKKHNVELHEVWDYDEDEINNIRIQKLIGFQSLCPSCHKVKHLGCTSLYCSNLNYYINWFDKINNINNINKSKVIIEHFFIEHNERSKHDWGFDITLLTSLKEII